MNLADSLLYKTEIDNISVSLNVRAKTIGNYEDTNQGVNNTIAGFVY